MIPLMIESFIFRPTNHNPSTVFANPFNILLAADGKSGSFILKSMVEEKLLWAILQGKILELVEK